MARAGGRKGLGVRDGLEDLPEAALLRLEINALRTELEFKNQNIALLNQLNANMHASLKSREVYYLVLTGVTAAPGLGFNRGLLFIRDPERPVMQGVLAIAPDGEDEMHRFYEEVEEKQFEFDFYVQQYYRNNLQVKNRLHDLVTGLVWERSASNILNDTLSSRKARYVRRAAARDFTGIEALRETLSKEFIIAPIVSAEEEIGVIIADNWFTDRELSPGDAAALQTLGKHAASMITAARSAETAANLAVEDPLTKAMNYRQLVERLTHETQRGRRYSRRFSLLLIDIDDFSRFNSDHGHLAGNKALIDLVALIRKQMRVVDTLARYGGEKFMVILPETDCDGARRAGEKIRRIVRQHRFAGAEGAAAHKLTVSQSVASFPEDGGDPAALLELATKRMHMAKAAGKDRVQFEG